MRSTFWNTNRLPDAPCSPNLLLNKDLFKKKRKKKEIVVFFTRICGSL